MTRADAWKKRPAVLRYWEFCDEIRELWSKQTIYEKFPDAVTLIFHLPMPKSWSNKKKLEMEGKPHQQRPDVDNILKGTTDSLCKEDAYIWAVKAEKRWSSTPGIEVLDYPET